VFTDVVWSLNQAWPPDATCTTEHAGSWCPGATVKQALSFILGVNFAFLRLIMTALPLGVTDFERGKSGLFQRVPQEDHLGRHCLQNSLDQCSSFKTFLEGHCQHPYMCDCFSKCDCNVGDRLKIRKVTSYPILQFTEFIEKMHKYV
jgi:hypothetical protein